MSKKVSTLLTAAIVTGMLASHVVRAEEHDAKSGDTATAAEKNSCKGQAADDKNSCKAHKKMKMKKKMKDKNSCKNGCGEAQESKEEAPKE